MKDLDNNQPHGNFVFLAIFVLILLAAFAGLTSCAPAAYVADQPSQELTKQHLAVFGTDIPEWVSREGGNYHIWFSNVTDSVQFTFVWVKDWADVSRMPLDIVTETWHQENYTSTAQGHSWTVPFQLPNPSPGLYILQLKGYGKGQEFYHEYRFEVL